MYHSNAKERKQGGVNIGYSVKKKLMVYNQGGALII
jgi:hypothetical protein